MTRQGRPLRPAIPRSNHPYRDTQTRSNGPRPQRTENPVRPAGTNAAPKIHGFSVRAARWAHANPRRVKPGPKTLNSVLMNRVIPGVSDAGAESRPAATTATTTRTQATTVRAVPFSLARTAARMPMAVAADFAASASCTDWSFTHSATMAKSREATKKTTGKLAC